MKGFLRMCYNIERHSSFMSKLRLAPWWRLGFKGSSASSSFSILSSTRSKL